MEVTIQQKLKISHMHVSSGGMCVGIKETAIANTLSDHQEACMARKKSVDFP